MTKLFFVRADQADGGSTVYVIATNERAARKQARAKLSQEGWTAGTLDVTDVTSSAQHWDRARRQDGISGSHS